MLVSNLIISNKLENGLLDALFLLFTIRFGSLSCVLGECNEGEWQLARCFILDSDYTAVVNIRVIKQEAFQLGRSDLEAFDLDQLLQAVDEEHVAIFVDLYLITTTQPPTRKESLLLLLVRYLCSRV